MQDAGCLTVVTGRSRAATAKAFGVDLDAAVPSPSQAGSIDPTTATASVTETANATAPDVRVCVVLEDNGVEGSREVVLRKASANGKAASVFWNTNGMVLFSCARRGKVLWSGELGMDDDADGLPRRLLPLAALAEATGEGEEVDPVAVGAAMVEAFTGVEVRAGVVPDAPWYVVTPHVEQPPAVNPESSPLKWSHPDLLAALASLAPTHRRPLTHRALHTLVRQASLAEDEVVAAALDLIGPDGPGVLPQALDSWERRWSREADRLGQLVSDALNGDGPSPPREEERAAYRAGWVSNALRYACHLDDRSALLGIADDMVTLFAMDDQEAAAVAALRAAVASGPADYDAAFSLLPPPPSPDERAAVLRDERRAREEEVHAAEHAEEAEWWGGELPTPRMRGSVAAHGLAVRDRELLGLLDDLTPGRLALIADWTARRVLTDAGLLELAWVRAATAGGADLQELFGLLFSDPEVRHTSFISDDGPCSRQAMALPAIGAYSAADPYDAACQALSAAGDGPRADADAIFREVRDRFELGGG